MGIRKWACISVLLSLVACGTTPADCPTPDGGPPRADSGNPGTDSGPPEMDAGTDGGEVIVPPMGPTDTDVVVARLNSDDTLDTGFATAGIARVDFGAGSADGNMDGNADVRDALWNMALDPSGRIL